MYCGSVQALLNFPAGCCETCVRGLAALQAFQRWKDGRTGLPLVDANMRELAETGVLHPTPSAPHVTLREWRSNCDSLNLKSVECENNRVSSVLLYIRRLIILRRHS